MSIMHNEFVPTYEATGQVIWMKKFVLGLRLFDRIKDDSEFTIMSQQYFSPIIISQVTLPSISTISVILLRRRFRIKPSKLSILEPNRCWRIRSERPV
jgi:hypothetical protein